MINDEKIKEHLKNEEWSEEQISEAMKWARQFIYICDPENFSNMVRSNMSPRSPMEPVSDKGPVEGEACKHPHSVSTGYLIHGKFEEMFCAHHCKAHWERKQMCRYEIVETVMLGFHTHNDQYDAFYDPGKGLTLEREPDGDTIYIVASSGRRKESITQAHAIDVWLEEGKIALIEEA